MEDIKMAMVDEPMMTELSGNEIDKVYRIIEGALQKMEQIRANNNFKDMYIHGSNDHLSLEVDMTNLIRIFITNMDVVDISYKDFECRVYIKDSYSFWKDSFKKEIDAFNKEKLNVIYNSLNTEFKFNRKENLETLRKNEYFNDEDN